MEADETDMEADEAANLRSFKRKVNWVVWVTVGGIFSKIGANC
jgi:hypothetical protein